MQENRKLKSVAKGTFDESLIEDGFIILIYQNNTNEVKTAEREIDSSYIQFHFCLKGA